MCIISAIAQAQSLRPGSDLKISDACRWLYELDGLIKAQIIDTHEGGEDIEVPDYTNDFESDTELLVPAPFDRIYPVWLACQIDLANKEYKRYDNSVMIYNAKYQAYADYYNRTHMPKSGQRKYF